MVIRKLSALILLIIPCVILFACSSSDDTSNNGEVQNQIIGTDNKLSLSNPPKRSVSGGFQTF